MKAGTVMTTANQTIKVAIIEDLAEVREGLGYLQRFYSECSGEFVIS
jgi:hypothetical protein